jgi:hypothetical protein
MGTDDEHERARPAVGYRRSGLAGQVISVYKQSGGGYGGPRDRIGEGLVTIAAEHVGHGVQVCSSMACDHPWQQGRSGHDP